MNDWTPNNGMYTRRIAVGAREIDQIVSYRPASTDRLTGYGHWGFSCWHGLEELRAPVYEYHTLEAATAAADKWLDVPRLLPAAARCAEGVIVVK